MTDRVPENIPGAAIGGLRSGADVVELEVLVPARLAVALESAASRRGLSMGQMMRRLVQDFLTEADECTISSSP
jgi:hypothetical protein